MFEVKDRDSKTLFIHDKILHTVAAGLEEKSVEGIVIAFPEEDMVQYEPTGKGLPVICHGVEVTQVDSLAQRALSLKTREDFQQLIRDAQERFTTAQAATKKKKAGTRGGTTAAPSITKQEVADLGVNLDDL